MIVPDFTPLSGPHPASVYHGIMMSMMDQGSNYGGFMARSPPHPLRSPPHMVHSPPNSLRSPPNVSRTPPHLMSSPPNLLGGTDALVGRPDIRGGHMHVPVMTTAHLTTKTDTVVSPISSEGRSGISPSSELSQVFLSSEDGDGGSPESYQRDTEEGGDKKAFKCPQCLYFTDRKNNLKRHIVTMHQECSKTLECCGVAFHSKAALRDHVGLFHRGGYRCQICSRNFCRKALLRRHLTVHSGRKDFSCNLCGYATSHKSNLERHQKVHIRRPVCAAVRENHDVHPSKPSQDRKTTSRYYPKFGHHRDRGFNRFVLLPNRLKYTHNTSRCDNRTDSRPYKSLSPLYIDDVETGGPFDKTAETVSKVRNGDNNNTQIADSHLTLSMEEPSCSDTENVQKVHKFSKLNSKRSSSSSKLSLLSSKRRIFVTPYKCCECGLSFSNQRDFHGHVCRAVRHSDDIGLSVITAVRKGKIKLLPQRDPSMKYQMSCSECAPSKNDSNLIQTV